MLLIIVWVWEQLHQLKNLMLQVILTYLLEQTRFFVVLQGYYLTSKVLVKQLIVIS